MKCEWRYSFCLGKIPQQLRHIVLINFQLSNWISTSFLPKNKVGRRLYIVIPLLLLLFFWQSILSVFTVFSLINSQVIMTSCFDCVWCLDLSCILGVETVWFLKHCSFGFRYCFWFSLSMGMIFGPWCEDYLCGIYICRIYDFVVLAAQTIVPDLLEPRWPHIIQNKDIYFGDVSLFILIMACFC